MVELVRMWTFLWWQTSVAAQGANFLFATPLLVPILNVTCTHIILKYKLHFFFYLFNILLILKLLEKILNS